MIGILALLLLLVLAAISMEELLSKAVSGFRSLPIPLRLGSAFFLGYSTTALGLSALSKLLNFHAGVVVLLVILLVTDVWLLGLRRRKRVKLEPPHVGAAVIIAVASGIGAVLLTTLFVLLMWIRSGVDPSSPWSFVGSLHSVRYAWISNFISTCEYVPTLGQNFAQSILAAVPGGSETELPYVSLTLLLATSLISLALTTFGLLSSRNIKSLGRVSGTLIVLLGGSALSLTHVLTIDSGSPFALNGYADTLAGVGLVVVFLLLLPPPDRTTDLNLPRLIAQVLVVSGLAFIAAPSLLLLLLFVVVWVILSRSDWRRRAGGLAGVGLASVLGLLLVLPLGGMLTPETLRTSIDYSGLMVPSSIAELKFLPGIPFYLPGAVEWTPGWSAEPFTLITGSDSPLSVSQYVWGFEEMIWRGLRLLFWPLLGSLLLIWTSRKWKYSLDVQNSVLVARLPRWSALFLIASGATLTFALSLGSFKWELARFLLPGTYLGLLGMGLWITALISVRGIRNQILGIGVAVLMLSGPVLHMTNLARARVSDVNSIEGRYALEVWGSGGPSIPEGACAGTRSAG